MLHVSISRPLALHPCLSPKRRANQAPRAATAPPHVLMVGVAVGSSLLPPQLHGLLGFALVFVGLQLIWHLLDLSDLLNAPTPLVPEKTIVILDGSQLVDGDGNGRSTEDLLSNPISVATFDSEGSRTDNDWERARRKEREEKRKAERREARKKKKSQPQSPPAKPEPEPVPEPAPEPVLEPVPQPGPELPAVRSVAVSVAATGATEATGAADASEACAPNATATAATAPPADAEPSPPPQLLSHQHRWWETPPTPLPSPPPSASPVLPTMSPVLSPAEAGAQAEAEAQAGAEAQAEAEAGAEAEARAEAEAEAQAEAVPAWAPGIKKTSP